MVTMSESDNEDLIVQQIQRDNLHFKALLNLIPPSQYFSNEDKLEIWGGSQGHEDDDDDDDEDQPVKKKKKKFKENPFRTLSVTQIIELREQGVQTDGTRQNLTNSNGSGAVDEISKLKEEKHKAKKQSRSSKANKGKGKELQRRESRLEELKERLRKKLEEIKARKNSGTVTTPQERKALKKEEKRLNARLKNKTKKSKEQRPMPVAAGLKSPPHNKILNQNGEPVKSKFDFSIISFGNEKSKSSSDLHGRDYKRLLEKVEKRKEKIEQLKEKDADAAKRLEDKIQWQTVMSKAKGEKVKDDAHLLQKAAKRKDKMKEKKQKKWGDRVKTVEDMIQKRQDKREANLNKRKDAKKDKKRKKMIKKGRIIPGF